MPRKSNTEIRENSDSIPVGEDADVPMYGSPEPDAGVCKQSPTVINTELLPREVLLNPNNLWLERYPLPALDQRTLNLSTVVAITVDTVYCTQKSFMTEKADREMRYGKEIKAIPSGFAVIAPLSAGWAKAPLEDRPGKDARFIADMSVCAETGARELLIRSFEKHESNPQYKGPVRDDLATLIRQGATLRMSTTMKTFEFEKKNAKQQGYKPLFPANMEMITPFTLVELTLKPNHAGRNEGGDLVQIKQIRVLPLTLHSFVDAMEKFPNTFDAQKVVTDHCKTFAPEGSAPCSVWFFGAGGECAFLDNVSPLMQAVRPDVSREHCMVQLVNVCVETASSPITLDTVDVSESLLLRYTNCKDVECACRFLELAACCQAVRLFVVRNNGNMRGDDNGVIEGLSKYRGIPVIDFYKMLQIDPSRGMEDPVLAFMSRVGRMEGTAPVSQDLPGDARVSYDPCTFMLSINTNHFYVFEADGVEMKRMIVIRVDLRVRDKKDAEDHEEGVSVDFQPYHRAFRLRKCCRVHIDLGPKLDSEGRFISNVEEKDYLCMLLNIASARPRAFGGSAVDAPRELKKRAAPSGCDGFDSD
ncbi:hypothetical protein GUITHDRAFT_118778 [Guillardia theta CCMP2712]|uniref:Uncharacterized protein n=1 Tax=Guillardia theta (strain CCMP2712) TaxID=905079 RepID=L1IGH2_GUITC|nr:hypothetical protein GUITHDRAFT_118778 [Guillardia theta CCMP2712]EKX35029.1 hypothetical protein GUITHDRAFT_118778 [Guillardia theta CCMP2712]|eukprot:XP_005822009.1 hypothetical protein GUITHDRAFT_118778 [Guillardia theta CCMP2712]